MSTFYVISYSAPRFTGRVIPEGSTEADAIRYIVGGHVEGTIERVDCADPEGGWARNVSEDVAIAIANCVDSWDTISPQVRDFIEHAAGLDYARGLRVTDKTFAAA